MRRKAVKVLTEEEFKKGYRKAQLIDVREPNEFDAGHILGARNIPVTQMKNRTTEIRQDLPVYLYCQTAQRSNRAFYYQEAVSVVMLEGLSPASFNTPAIASSAFAIASSAFVVSRPLSLSASASNL